ncbi:metal-dependent phosphohydrolase, HD subdomain protein [Saccharopolyspora subtropica]|uniref:Metal-dependent phosphohydrolase, HD subdomain protein n=1 Tax=Saccharopolyspora thermophila TaxID=89367 RepID=A0A917JPX1_9PSEU|nr:HD domain-containing protein [Saccharopolyspora subtropica]GGI76738.1 metal-dependent phosphohydrolase, HD subdomain protein [Saccharopolyspora subtropica]
MVDTRGKELVTWAFATAEQKLAEALPRRWAHVQGVARRARELRPVAGSEADILEAAAVLHDVGYAPDIAHTGFHPLDGARFLQELGAPDRVVHLVAHHSYAALEAELRGLAAELAEYDDEGGVIRDALWCCDLTTTPDGASIAARDRIAEIKQRYGPGHLVTEFITNAAPELLAAVDRTKERLSAATAIS